jgi:hypothetical protein
MSKLYLKPILEECIVNESNHSFNIMVNMTICCGISKGGTKMQNNNTYYYLKFEGIGITWIFESRKEMADQYDLLVKKYSL